VTAGDEEDPRKSTQETFAQRDVAAQAQTASPRLRCATTRRGSAGDRDGVSGHGGNGF